MFLAVLDRGGGGNWLNCSLFEIPCDFTGDIPVFRKTGIWICYIAGFFFFP